MLILMIDEGIFPELGTPSAFVWIEIVVSIMPLIAP